MRFVGTLLLALFLVAPASAANIVIVNLDANGEGFNDPTPATPIGGNAGTTIGQQRLNVFQAAADIWGALLPSDVTIRVNSNFDPLDCDAVSAVLGSAGPIDVFRDFSGAEFPGTWYHVALANRLAGSDLAAGSADISARFNSSIDNNDACLQSTNWYYGLDGVEGSDTELLPVVLHELGHGLGFSEFVNTSTGSLFLGLPDVYSRFLRDESNGLLWSEMTNAQRLASATRTGEVVWDGFAVNFAAPSLLDGTPVLDLLAPAAIAGAVAELGGASFGPALTETPITGPIVLAEDGTAPTSDACTSLVNGAAIAGNIALIDRGACAFTQKVQAAEAEGAVAVIIVNNVAGAPPLMGGTDPGLTIPTVSITLDQGNLIKAQLGVGVTGTLVLDQATLAGTHPVSGKLLVYTPNPLQPGSSVSHWDVSASPSLLMEPAITGGLSSTVDLTKEHFEDIGWFEPRLTDAPSVGRTRLEDAVPNPFNPRTEIAFVLDRDSSVRLDVYDLAGRHVTTLADGERTAGRHTVTWNGLDAGGSSVASGVYVYRLRAAGVDETKQMMLLK